LAAGYLEGRCGRYLGIDHSARLIDFARAGHVGDGIDFRATGVEELTGVGGFDLAFTIGVLHHLENAVAAVSKIVGLLKPGGYFVANEPQPANQVVSAARRMRNRFDRTYSVDQDELSQSELRGILEGAGLTAVKVTAQGVFSTPFAEVVMGPQVLTAPAARLACRVDGFLERKVPGLLKYLSWNLIAVGQKPGAGAVADVPAPEG
jgi:SAM-dependent methyltransferase